MYKEMHKQKQFVKLTREDKALQLYQAGADYFVKEYRHVDLRWNAVWPTDFTRYPLPSGGGINDERHISAVNKEK